MAIEDDKNYTLTGAQIKDLVQKVKTAQSTIYELTTDDFNWNSSTQTTENPNAIALWLLPTGLYYYSSYSGYGAYVSNNRQVFNGVAIVMEASTGIPAKIIWQANGSMSKMYMAAVLQTGAFDQGPYLSTFVSE